MTTSRKSGGRRPRGGSVHPTVVITVEKGMVTEVLADQPVDVLINDTDVEEVGAGRPWWNLKAEVNPRAVARCRKEAEGEPPAPDQGSQDPVTAGQEVGLLVEASEQTLADIQGVLENWESGDLAGAVNRLSSGAAVLRQRVDQLKETQDD